MGFTTIRTGSNNVALVMDDAFFARPLTVTTGTNGDDFILAVTDPGSTATFGPYTSPAVPPFTRGVQDLFGDGSPELVQWVYPANFRSGGWYWDIAYYTLEPDSAAQVNDLQLDVGAAIGRPLFTVLMSFGYQAGQTSPILHLNDFAPGTTTVGDHYDRDAANRIEGRGLNDLLLGFGGGDTISGEFGADSIDGGDGNDLITATAAYVTIEGGGTTFLPFGDGSLDSLRGGADNDTVLGDNDADLLFGDSGNDLLVGYAGADKVNGGTGHDTLEGGNGADVLTGGKGGDVFRYTGWGSVGRDKIKDFDPAEDQIQVSASFAGLVAGMDVGATGHFVAKLNGKATTPGVSQFVYDTDDGRLFWDPDGAGGVDGILLATLTGAPTLTAADITVIA